MSTTTERKVVLTTREMWEVSGIDMGKLFFGHDRVLCVGGLESKISEYDCEGCAGVDHTALGMASVVITLRQTPRVIARHSGIFEGLAMLQLRFRSDRGSPLERQTDSLVEAQKNQTVGPVLVLEIRLA